MIAALPYALYSIILGIFDGLSDPMSIFCIVLLLGACLIGMLACFACFRSCNTAAKALKQAKKELNRLVKSADYIKTAAENRELRKKNEDLAEQWHRAWYQWVCSTKKAAADAQEDWPEEVRANIEMMRKSFNQDAFKKQVDNADFNELLRQEKQKPQN